MAHVLSNLKYEIVIYDINNSNENFKKFEHIERVQGDTNDKAKLLEICQRHNFDGVVHLAAISRVVVAQNNQEECIRTNVHGTRTLLEVLGHSSMVKQPWLIFGSSREVYGEPHTLPVLENFDKKHVNIYGDSKIQGENMFTDFANRHNSSAIILRFANVYGNQFDLIDRVIPRFIKAINSEEHLTIEGGDQVIDFTHIDDTVDTIIKAIKHIEASEQLIDDFHILPGIGWSLYDAISHIEKHLGKKANIKVNEKRNFDVEKFVGDPSKIKTILNSRDFIGLDEGLKLAIPKYLEVLS